MDWIRVRHLLNTAQHKLATLLNLEPLNHHRDRSFAWRQWAQCKPLSVVCASFQEAPGSDDFAQLISSDRAMNILTQPSVYRTKGDNVAHPSSITSGSVIKKAVEAIAQESDKAALLVMVECVWK